jgi:Ribbon-helix-helix protein, copG family
MTDGPHVPVEEMITVYLTDAASAALRELHARSGMSKTDLINRALHLYDYWDQQVRNGTTWVMRHSDGTTETVKLK